jgi:hypothetical protein
LGRIEIMFAIRFDSAKNAAIAPMSQMSSSVKPCSRNVEKSASSIAALFTATFIAKASIARWRADRHLHRECEHCALARRYIGLPIIDGDLVGHERILRVDPQDRAVRNDAVQAIVRAGRRDDYHLPLGLRQPAFLEHQCVVICEERTELVGPVRERDEYVRNEPCLLLHFENPRADVVRQFGECGYRVAGDRRRHGEGGT